MIKTSQTIKVRRSSGKELSDRMQTGFRVALLQSASAFLDTLLTDDNVPVWTGRLYNSFRALDDALRDRGVRRPSFPTKQPTESAREWFKNSGGQDKWGTIDEDWTHLTKTFLPRKNRKGQVTFTFSSSVPYYPGNDTEGLQPINVQAKLHKPTPWGSQSAAFEEFTAQMQTRVLKIAKSILISHVKNTLSGSNDVLEDQIDLDIVPF